MVSVDVDVVDTVVGWVRKRRLCPNMGTEGWPRLRSARTATSGCAQRTFRSEGEGGGGSGRRRQINQERAVAATLTIAAV